MIPRERERLVTLLYGLRTQLRAALDAQRSTGAPGEVRARLATSSSALDDALLLCQHGRHGSSEWALYAEDAAADAEHALALYAAWQCGYEEAHS